MIAGNFGQKAGLMKANLRADRGSSLLELALILPLLMLTMIGAAELGRIAYASIEVSNAARAGVAYGAQNLGTMINSSGTVDPTGVKNAAQNEASNITITFPTPPALVCVCETVNLSSGAISDTPITGACNGPTSTALTTQCTASTTSGVVKNLVHYVQVSTQANVNTMFKFNWNGKGLPSSFTLNGSAKMRVLQE